MREAPLQEIVTYFEPQPAPAEVPARLTSPFESGPPHPLARRAALELQERLRRGELPEGCDPGALDAPGGGKMFGVLVVATSDGRIGYLRGFSGMLCGRWDVEGFAPPLFDPIARDTFWPAGEAELGALALHHAELSKGAEPVALRARLAELDARHAEAVERMRARHEANRRLRHDSRRRLAEMPAEDDARRRGANAPVGDEARRGLAEAPVGNDAPPAVLLALEAESRADAAERRQLVAAYEAEREREMAALRVFDARRAEVEHQRAERSRRLWQQLSETYVIPNARGEQQSLSSLFAPEPPPGGAGDCAAPKLLGLAYRHHLRPLALAEFWWGASPRQGERHAGSFYPACQSKCGRVLPYMLEGLSVDPAPLSAAALPVAEPRLVFEDPWLLVVDKPCGLPPAPSRHDRLRDSALVRLQRRFPDAVKLLVVNALDAEASGLLLVAKDPETQSALQRQFARREAEARHIAWLDGQVTGGDHGTVELPIRSGPGERLSHIVDPVHGKRAITEWRVTQRTGTRTLVSLVPRTRLTHQLRVHAAHPLGLGAPIVGDRLYVRDDTRLMLHAEALSFLHPHTGERVELESPPPF